VTRDDVSVLYVDPTGPYPEIVTDWWGADRDARLYAGPRPIVAHPPCGPWGRLAHMCRHQDVTLAPIAVRQVQRWGGVLEHPADSRLWPHCGLPLPGGQGDLFSPRGDHTIEIEQWWWGHPMPKRTWLYVVGAARMPPLPAELPARPRYVPAPPLPGGGGSMRTLSRRRDVLGLAGGAATDATDSRALALRARSRVRPTWHAPCD
jgi:hypothetical protein